MGLRLLIAGGVAAGASCAARARRLSEEAEIVVFERTDYPSFSNCGMPYHLGGVIAERQKITGGNVKMLRERFRIDVRTGVEVTRIDRGAKRIEVRDVRTGRFSWEAYDALVLAPGAKPIRPPVPGIDLPGVHTLRHVADMDAIAAHLARGPRRAVVVGGGFIGLEMVENLARRGLAVALVEKLPQVMPPLDPEMLVRVHGHLRAKGIALHLGDGLAAIERQGDGLRVVTGSGQSIEGDLVLLSAGVRPDIELAQSAGLEIGPRGGIRVDDQMRTSDPHIWAAGDAVEVRDIVTGEPALLALAGPANRQGRLAAEAIFGQPSRFRGVQGTSVVGVFDLTVAMTGASERRLRAAGIPCKAAHLHTADHAGYYPGAQAMHLKLIFDPNRGTVLGAQAVGGRGVDKRIDVIAMAMQMGATVHDLAEAELAYAPQYGAAKDPVNMAGMVGVAHLRGESPLLGWDEIEEADVILDVRTPAEVEGGRVPGSVNIPLDALRERLGELPRGQRIAVHCAAGVRSHAATRLLRLRGFDAHNLTGGFRSYEDAEEAGRVAARVRRT